MARAPPAQTQTYPHPRIRPHNPAMPGRKHTPEERAEIEAIARQMRIDGVDMVTISKAVGVSIATLYLWAKQSGWREQDLPRPALVLPARSIRRR